MPIYMDRHDVPEMITAEIVADMHQKDLKIQHKFDCRGLTYWFDDKRKTAFCLIDAPNVKSVINMHEQAHGEVPHKIIEVEAAIVESFLGRIEDPEKALNSRLNIINDPAFRTIMVISLQNVDYKNYDSILFNESFKKSISSISKTISEFYGRIVNQNDDGFLISFESVTNSVLCAKAVQSQLNQNAIQTKTVVSKLKIGLAAGVPVTERKLIFEDTIKLAERMKYISEAEIVVSSEVRDLYKSENSNQFFDNKTVFVLSSLDEKFLNSLFDFIESEWQNTNLKVDDFGKEMGFSKSQLYRKMMLLIGESPNSFLMNYRLDKAFKLLKKRSSSISEIAFNSGFSSPSYFSKCFLKKYKFSPSAYFQQKN